MSAAGLLLEHSAELKLDTYTQVSGGVVILLQVDVEKQWLHTATKIKPHLLKTKQKKQNIVFSSLHADLFILCVSAALFTTWTPMDKGTLTNWTVKNPPS